MPNSLLPILDELSSILDAAGDEYGRDLIRQLISQAEVPEEFWTFANSNSFWGGSGSLADQSGLNIADDKTIRYFRGLMAQFAEVVSNQSGNAQAASWSEAFKGWSKKN
jgi:hypothetical protein